MIHQDYRLPGDLIYGNSHAVYSALERPPRYMREPMRWYWPDVPQPPAWWHLRERWHLLRTDRALRRAYQQMHRRRGRASH